MNLKEVASASDYLTYFDQCFDRLNIHEFPKLHAYYQRLYQEFIASTESEQSFFSCMKEILLIEAKCQILLILIQHIQYTDTELTEEQLIRMAEDDSTSYYRELMGQQKSSFVTWRMIYLSEE